MTFFFSEIVFQISDTTVLCLCFFLPKKTSYEREKLHLIPWMGLCDTGKCVFGLLLILVGLSVTGGLFVVCFSV